MINWLAMPTTNSDFIKQVMKIISATKNLHLILSLRAIDKEKKKKLMERNNSISYRLATAVDQPKATVQDLPVIMKCHQWIEVNILYCLN